MTRLRRALRDPFTVSVGVLSALVVAGLAGVGVAWKGAAASLDVAVQLPYIVSGALGGLGLAGFGVGLLIIQARRRREAVQRAEMARLVTAAANVLAAVRQRRR